MSGPEPLTTLGRMLRRTFTALLVGLLAVFLPASSAFADDESAPITRMDIDVDLEADGTAHVTLDLTMDFAQRRGRGPVFQFYTTQKDGQNPDEEYVFDYSRPDVESTTGAATDVNIDEGSNAVVWRIGDEDRFNDSAEDYRITFDLRGVVVPEHPESGLDEFNWQVFSDVESEVSNITASVRGPAAVERAACFQGTGNTDPCPSSVRDGAATMRLGSIPHGQGVQLVAGFPAGTFPGVEQTKRRVPTLVSNLTPGPVGLGIAGGLSAVAALGSWALGRRAKRDLVYLGLTPGTVPTREDEAAVGLKDTSKVPVAVQFQPPKDAKPGEIGTLVDATADGVDVTATLVDLAVRGHLVIEPQTRKEFVLHRTNGGRDRLDAHERWLLESIFAGATTRSTRELRDKRFHDIMSTARDHLYKQMVRRKWFVRNPSTSGSLLAVAGGVVLSVMLWEQSLALLGLPLIVAGIGCWYVCVHSNRRTALGSAMLQQTRGFELYLRTAEADQIRFEEGIDVFSRYLPYAMVFGVADRWAKVFERLEAEGRYHSDTSWITSDSSAYYWAGRMDGFSSSFSGALSAAASSYEAAQASSGSSGGSGFSGGGGFGGGSVGSW